MTNISTMKVLIVDDHPLMRVGIAAIIDAQSRMVTIAQAGSGEEAIEMYQQHLPDVTLMDLRVTQAKRGRDHPQHTASTSAGAVCRADHL